MNDQQIKDLAVEISKTVEDSAGEIGIIAKMVITEVEKLQKVKTKVQSLSSEEKQAIAVAVLDLKVDLPFPLSMCKKFLLKLGVNYLVGKLNDKFGKDWLERPSSNG